MLLARERRVALSLWGTSIPDLYLCLRHLQPSCASANMFYNMLAIQKLFMATPNACRTFLLTSHFTENENVFARPALQVAAGLGLSFKDKYAVAKVVNSFYCIANASCLFWLDIFGTRFGRGAVRFMCDKSMRAFHEKDSNHSQSNGNSCRIIAIALVHVDGFLLGYDPSSTRTWSPNETLMADL